MMAQRSRREWLVLGLEGFSPALPFSYPPSSLSLSVSFSLQGKPSELLPFPVTSEDNGGACPPASAAGFAPQHVLLGPFHHSLPQHRYPCCPVFMEFLHNQDPGLLYKCSFMNVCYADTCHFRIYFIFKVIHHKDRHRDAE